MSKFILIMGALLYLGAGLPVAHAELSVIGDRVSITGQATFERKATLIPLVVCQAEPCSHSHVYWNLVIVSNGTRYELEQKFAVDHQEAPQAVELSNVVIRPGSRVSLVGQVQTIDRSLAIVTDVEDVTLVMDDIQAEIIQPQDPELTFYGWTCHGTDGQQPQMYVKLWRSGLLGSEPAYTLRVIANNGGQDGSFYDLATIKRVRSREQSNTLVYQGADNASSAELTIGGTTLGYNELRSELKLSMMRPPSGMNFPFEMTTPLLCSRTRFLQ